MTNRPAGPMIRTATRYRKVAVVVGRESNPTSELVLQRKLHLTRRTRVACWEPRVRDLAEVCATDHATRLTEIRVIEHIENFPAKLYHLVLSQFRSFDYREVGVVETRTDHYVAAEVAKASHRYDKRRGIKPAIRRSEDLDRASNVRSHGVVGACERRIVRDDVYGVAAL